MPLYYAQPLKRALQRMMSIPNLVPDTMDTCLSFRVLSYLKGVKNQAKIEFEKLVSLVGKVPTHNHIDSIKIVRNPYTKSLQDLVLLGSENHAENSQNGRKASLSNNKNIIQNELMNQKFLHSIRNDLNEFPGFSIRIKDRMKEAKPQCFKNAFDINRNDLIDQIARMKINFLQKNISDIKMHTDEQLHSLPIAQMGNYQEYLKKVQPSLRELEQQPVRQHMFGNPFKFDKKVQMMVDEADIDLMNSGGNVNNGNKSLKRPPSELNQGGRLIKRKPGPLPKDFVLKRPGSPALTTISSNQSNSSQTSSQSSNSTTNGLTMADKLNANQSEMDGENCFILNRSNSSLINSKFNSSPALANSIDSLSDHSLSSSNSSLNDLNDSDLESQAPISISTLMNNNNTTSPSITDNNSNPMVTPKPLTGLHLLSKQSSMITSLSTNSLINLTDDDIQMKKLLFKQIRRPGHNYESMINSLNKHKNAVVKNYLVHEVINEARRFKKTTLVNLLMKKFPFAKVYSTTNGS